MLGFNVVHIGINEGMERINAEQFKAIFGFALKGENVLARDTVEALKASAPGTHGHIIIGTSSILRTIAYLERTGTAFDYAQKDPKGDLTGIYLEKEFFGFAVHFIQQK